MQQAFPKDRIALREHSDLALIPAGVNITIYEVDIESTTLDRPPWAKHDNATKFMRSLAEGDLEVYEVDVPLPGFLPYSSVNSTTRLLQTEEAVLARKMRQRIEKLGYMLKGVGLNE
jgi:hypothetical protein